MADEPEATHGEASEGREGLRKVSEKAARARQIADKAAFSGGEDAAAAVRDLADGLEGLARYIADHHDSHTKEGQSHHH